MYEWCIRGTIAWVAFWFGVALGDDEPSLLGFGVVSAAVFWLVLWLGGRVF